MARRRDVPGSDGGGVALHTALLIAGAVTIVVLVALALMQWFARLT